MNRHPADSVKFEKFDDLFGNDTEQVTEVELSKLYDFKDHPFKVLDDEAMAELIESIKEKGVIVPALARPFKDGYELISGHRRKHAAEAAGLSTMPVMVREMTDDEAVIAMVDANLQRPEILPSEKAFSYKMKFDAMKHQGKSGEGSTAENVGAASGDGISQVRRYIRLTFLISDILELVDTGRIALGPAVELSYIPQTMQKVIFEEIGITGVYPDMEKAGSLKELANNGKLDNMTVNMALMYRKPAERKFLLNNKRLKEYFPENYTTEDIEKVVTELLESWKAAQGR